MNLYFFAPKEANGAPAPSNAHALTPVFNTILTTLRENPRHRLISNLEPHSLASFLKELKIQAPLFNAHALDSIDAFVIHHQEDEHELSYILSFALIRKRPLLYLIPKFSAATPSLRYLKHLQNSKSQKLKVFFYDTRGLPKIMARFCSFLDGYTPHTQTSIKFTLRLSQAQHDYLLWRCQKTRQAKADLLRDFIQKQLIDPDADYIKYLKKRTGERS